MGGAEMPALHAAARDGDLHAVRSLLKRIDVMSRDPWGETPLHWASNAKVADCLIAAGASVHQCATLSLCTHPCARFWHMYTSMLQN